MLTSFTCILKIIKTNSTLVAPNHSSQRLSHEKECEQSLKEFG